MTTKEKSKWNKRTQCSAIHCKNYQCDSINVAFHRFPKDPDRCARWVQNLGNASLMGISSQRLNHNYRVCSAHFHTSQFKRPSNVHAGLKWDAVPTMVNASNQPPTLDLELRRKPPKTRQKLPPKKRRRLLKKEAVPTLHELNNYSTATPQHTGDTPPLNKNPVAMDFQQSEHDYCSSTVPAAVDLSLDQIEDLRKEVEHLRKQVQELSVLQKFCLGQISASDDDVRFYTRFVTYNHLMAFWRLIEPASHKMVRVSRAKAATTRGEVGATGSASDHYLQPIDEFFLFMVHLSLGLTQRDLAHRFNIPQSIVTRIITTWANFLYTVLGSERIWMSEEAVKAHMPKEFQDYPETQVVIYCTELRCQTPSSLLLQREVFSSYNSNSTFKGLIGMAPHGAVTFVSSLFEGSISNKELLNQCGIVPLLKTDMAIMVDKDFLVDDCVPCNVYRPFLSKHEQMTADKETQSIAHLRVHVERLIHRVKQNKLFDTVIPLSITGRINQLYTVACLLVNYQNGPLVTAWAKD